MKREGVQKGERDQKLLNFFSLTYSQSCILRLMFTERINKRRLIGNIFPSSLSLLRRLFIRQSLKRMQFSRLSITVSFLSSALLISIYLSFLSAFWKTVLFSKSKNSAYFSSHSFFAKEFSFCKIVFSACVNFFQGAAFPFRIFSPFLQRFNYCSTLPSLDSRIFQRTFCSSPQKLYHFHTSACRLTSRLHFIFYALSIAFFFSSLRSSPFDIPLPHYCLYQAI